MKSIKKQMLIYLMIGILVLLGMLFLISHIILKDLPIHTKEQYSEIANARAEEVSKELKGFVDQVEMLSKSPIVRKMQLDQLKGYLPNLVLSEKHRNITIIYPDGNGWSTVEQELNILDEEQYQEIFVKNKEFMISQPFISPYTLETRRPIVVVSHSVKDDNNKTVGAVNVVIKIDFLNEIVSDINLKDSNYSWIVNEKGTIVAHSSLNSIVSNNIKIYIKDDEYIIDKISEVDSGIIEYKDEKGEKILGFFNQIKDSPGWTLMVSIEEKEIYKELNTFKDIMFFSTIVGLLLAFIFSYFYGKTLSDPILSLKEVFNEAANGNLNVKANEDIQNELGLAGKSFNTMIDKIKYLTYKDTVTDTFNYNGFLLEMYNIIERLKDKDEWISVAIISIDDFKKINTIKGYDVGDEVLHNLAKNIYNFIDEEEIIGRISGDEFIVFLYNKEIDILEKRLCKLRKLCNGEINIREDQFGLKTSIGASIMKNSDMSIKDIIHQATVAKLIVKKMGGNNFKFYNFELDQFIEDEQKMEDDLYRAIENNELKLVYQPIVEVATNKVETTEALLRWTNPLYETISPLIIIGIAERSDLIIEIGEWVLRQACRQNKEWQDKGYSPIVISVNISVIHFEQINFVEMVRKILHEVKMEPKYLELEITETNVMNSVEEKLIRMRQLKDMGVRISIDNFGTGYSSLSYFAKFPIDTLKIDRSFINNMMNDENSKTVVDTIISMAKAIKINITAEGIETLEQLKYLKEKGCNKVQGDYFSMPVEPIKILEMLEKIR